MFIICSLVLEPKGFTIALKMKRNLAILYLIRQETRIHFFVLKQNTLFYLSNVKEIISL